MYHYQTEMVCTYIIDSMNKIIKLIFVCTCVAFIVGKRRSISVIEYNILFDKCELEQKRFFVLELDYFVNYDGNCGICILDIGKSNHKSGDAFTSNELKLRNDNLNDIDQDPKYNIILFGTSYSGTFMSSLQWLSLEFVNNNDTRLYDISIDEDKTTQFQNTVVDQNIFASCRYNSFGYTKWKHYLILFGGYVDTKSINSIFYFDFFEMKWYKSLRVL